MKFKTIIFDFDGTIADTQEAMIRLFNEVSAKYNLPKIDSSNKEELRNLSMLELAKELKISRLKLVQISKEILPKLKKDLDQINLIPGMEKLLYDLKNNGFKVGVVSSNSKENIELFLANHKIDCIDFVYSEKGLFGKDKVLKHVIKKHNLDDLKTIYVGDESRDIDAARGAGLPIISVTWGLNSKERLAKSQPEYIFDKPEEILKELINI